MVGLFAERAQDEVWADDPDALVSGVITPSATTVKVPGGLRVTGKWYYNSGSHHSDWAVLGVPLVDESGEEVDSGLVLVPRRELGFQDTWFVAGMRASGSNALIADDLFVPDHRIISTSAALEGHYATEHTDETLYRSAFIPVLALVLLGPQLGVARAALAFVREKSEVKGVAHTVFARQSESTAFQLQFAEASLRVDTAHLHASRATADVDDAAAGGTYPDALIRSRIRADLGWAVDQIQQAMQILLYAHGAASFAESNPLQRMWRDVSVAARHGAALPIVNYEIYGKALLNRPEPVTPMV